MHSYILNCELYEPVYKKKKKKGILKEKGRTDHQTCFYLNVLICSSHILCVLGYNLRVHHPLFQAAVSYHFSMSLCHWQRKNWLCVMPFWAMIGWHGFRDNQDFRQCNRNKKKRKKKNLSGRKVVVERDKIFSLVLRRHDQALFLRAFRLSQFPTNSITDSQPCVAEGIILI